MQTRLRPEHDPQDLRRQSVKKDPPLVGDNNTLALDLLQARRFGDRVLLRHFGFGRGDGLRLHKRTRDNLISSTLDPCGIVELDNYRNRTSQGRRRSSSRDKDSRYYSQRTPNCNDTVLKTSTLVLF